jgi:hypothetical protein
MGVEEFRKLLDRTSQRIKEIADPETRSVVSVIQVGDHISIRTETIHAAAADKPPGSKSE